MRTSGWGRAAAVLAALTATVPVALVSAGPARAADPAPVGDPTAYVNPLIGSTASGDTYPGATVPFGMIQWSPVTATGNLYSIAGASGSYSYTTTKLRGFSLTHLNGTGCAGLDSDVPILPYTSDVTTSPSTDTTDATYASTFSHANETAVPGDYKVTLDNGVTTELSTTKRTGNGQFTFPAGTPANVLFRVSNSGLGSGDPTNVTIDPATSSVSGEVTGGGFCGANGVTTNNRDYYHLFFVAQFDRPLKSYGTWQDATVSPGSTSASGGEGYTAATRAGKGSGAWVGFDTTTNATVGMRVGISYVSQANALANLNAEDPAGTTLASVKQAAHDTWQNELSRIQVTPGATTTDDQLTVFYTALYHALLQPTLASDVNGQYEGADDQHGTPGGTQTIDPAKQQAEYDTLSGWDQYRGQVQLLTLVDPQVGSDFAQSLLNLAGERNGEWDRWLDRSGKTSIMEGDPSPSVESGIYAFGGRQFDVAAAEQSLFTAATVPTANDALSSGDSTIGAGCAIGCPGQRPSLANYLALGYVPSQNCDCWGAAGETIEDANADFSIAELAHDVGDDSTYKQFLQRGEWWQNVFDPALTSGTFSGYIWNRSSTGAFAGGFSATSQTGFAEGSTTQYSWMVYDDVAKLASLMGGDAATAARLDAFFAGYFNGTGSSGARFDPTNEPDIQTPWMYDFLGKASATQSTVRQIIDKAWTNTTGGITGNDDLGTMSAWNVWASLGMYPYTPGQSTLVLASPLFPHIVIKRPSGQTITIDAPGADASTPYVQSLNVDGVATDKPWLPASFVNSGGTLDYTLGATASDWGSAANDAPPSLSDPPTISITDDATGAQSTAPVHVTVSAADAMSGVDGSPSCTIDGLALPLTDNLDGSWSATVTSFGAHDVQCSVANELGTTASATDAFDRWPTSTVGGTTPATLALTLGAPASFGTFLPGVASSYTATTSANVISTAGDAALSVSDPDTVAPGHLVNGAFALPSPLLAGASSPAGTSAGAAAPVGGSASPTALLSWAGPVANDPVTVTFRQAIGANDALRTGSYAKTLTFTLSTTTP